MRQFPVLGYTRTRIKHPECPASVPWEMLAPHADQAKRNHSQTLERLAERGGLSPCEMLWILEGVGWRGGIENEDLAIPILKKYVEEFLKDEEE